MSRLMDASPKATLLANALRFGVWGGDTIVQDAQNKNGMSRRLKRSIDNQCMTQPHSFVGSAPSILNA